MAKKKIIILGAGLSGLSAAWHLKKDNLSCRIFEKESESGGLCRSKSIAGFTFDYCGHLLHFKNAYTLKLISRELGVDLVKHKRNSWIYSFDSYSRYPFQANLHGLPAEVVKQCFLGFIQAQENRTLCNQRNGSFLDWIERTFGDGIARNFMIPYNTKFWTVPPDKLTCDWLDGFIPVPSLDQLVDGAIKDSHRQFGYNAWFWYPKEGGIGRIPQAFSGRLKNEIVLGCAVKGIDLIRKVIILSSGKEAKFDYLVSTIPLPELRNLILKLPEQVNSLWGNLRWSSIFNLNVGLDEKDKRKRHWIYFPQKKEIFFRVGFFHNFSYSLMPRGKSALYIEVAYSRDKPVDKKKAVHCILRDLEKVGILKNNSRPVVTDTNDIKYGYILYDKNYLRARTGIVDYLSRHSVLLAGRYGNWKYFSMEDAILDGKRVAQQLAMDAR